MSSLDVSTWQTHMCVAGICFVSRSDNVNGGNIFSFSLPDAVCWPGDSRGHTWPPDQLIPSWRNVHYASKSFWAYIKTGGGCHHTTELYLPPFSPRLHLLSLSCWVLSKNYTFLKASSKSLSMTDAVIWRLHTRESAASVVQKAPNNRLYLPDEQHLLTMELYLPFLSSKGSNGRQSLSLLPRKLSQHQSHPENIYTSGITIIVGVIICIILTIMLMLDLCFCFESML